MGVAVSPGGSVKLVGSLAARRFTSYLIPHGEKKVHRRLPYQKGLNCAGQSARTPWCDLPNTLIVHDQFVDLGLTQHCEHTNKEMTLTEHPLWGNYNIRF